MRTADLIEELIDVANSAALLRTNIRDEKLSVPLSAIRKACGEIDRAWSGSNIGYHATVYVAGLQAKPANVQFSSKWGLMNQWPTHEPNPLWQIFDDETVLKEIQRRAGNPDLDALTKELDQVRDGFCDLQERTKSIFIALTSGHKDAFLDEKLARITKLTAPRPSAVGRQLLPSGQFWSRDSLAMTQGLRLAPHQTAVALPCRRGRLKRYRCTGKVSKRDRVAHSTSAWPK